ncbi:MAG: tetratricopeptide repeat protein [Blastomonas sp.]
MINRILAVAGMGLVAMAAPALAQEAPAAKDSEIGYEAGELGFAALRKGDYRTAINQMESAEQRDPNDPARMINLGHAHAKLGQTDAARQYFQAAISSRKSFDIILANGKVVDSRAAAREALKRLDVSAK